jgi:hypothetical protein
MATPLTTFPLDRSERWILLPGVASTRQFEIRNDTDSPLEVHLRVDAPAAASATPAIMTIEPHHSRIAEIIFLATWSPMHDRRVSVSLRDPQGQNLGSFTHEIVPADSADCNLSLELRDDFLVDGFMMLFKLWCTVESRSATPRRFDVDFSPHPSLRFPQRRTVTLAPGESSAFEVTVQWNRSIRDVAGWNHPKAIEAYVPVANGRRSTVLVWESIEGRAASYITADDRGPKATVPQSSANFLEKMPGQLKYEELIEARRLEQGVVAPAYPKPAPVPEISSAATSKWRNAVAPFVTIALALAALVLAGLFFMRTPGKQVADQPVPVTPLRLSPAPPAHPPAKHLSAAPVATPVWTSPNQAATQPNAVTPAAEQAAASQPALSLAPARPAPQPTVNRNQVVALTGVEAAYVAGGHAVNVQWSGQAQASALIQIVDFSGKVIAARSVRGTTSSAVLRLPRGYRGPVSVNVTAYGYHGERVAQSASLSPQE